MASQQKIFAYLLALLVCVAVVESGAISKRRASYYGTLNDLAQPEDDDTMTRADDLILRLLDAIVAHEESRGASKDEMHDLVRKRAGIRKCFFHAVNCW